MKGGIYAIDRFILWCAHGRLEKEEPERAGRFRFFERPEGDEIITDADDFHGGAVWIFIGATFELIFKPLFSSFREECPAGMLTWSW